MEKRSGTKLSLSGSVLSGTDVKIGASIFVLMAKTVELAGQNVHLAFLVSANVVGFSVYPHVKL